MWVMVGFHQYQSGILELYSHYIGQLLCCLENHSRQGFCSHTRTIVISVMERSCPALISKVERRISDRFFVILWHTVNTYSRAQNNFRAVAGHDDRPKKFYLNHVQFSICECDFIFTRRQNLRSGYFFSRIKVSMNGQYDQ